MDSRKVACRVALASALALAFAGTATAQRHRAPAPHEEQPAAAPTPGNTVGYGVKLGGFFTDTHKEVAKKSFAQHFAKT